MHSHMVYTTHVYLHRGLHPISLGVYVPNTPPRKKKCNGVVMGVPLLCSTVLPRTFGSSASLYTEEITPVS